MYTFLFKFCIAARRAHSIYFFARRACEKNKLYRNCRIAEHESSAAIPVLLKMDDCDDTAVGLITFYMVGWLVHFEVFSSFVWQRTTFYRSLNKLSRNFSVYPNLSNKSFVCLRNCGREFLC